MLDIMNGNMGLGSFNFDTTSSCHDFRRGFQRFTNTAFTSPQALVHCAANRFPDKVDADPEGTRLLNVEATRTLAKACASRGILLIYISTDYVFSGKPGEAPYQADSATGPTNLYGVTKLDGEKAVIEEFSKAGKEGLGVVMRVPVLYGKTEEGRNEESAVNVLLDAVLKAQEGKVKMDHWALRFPTNTEDVGRVCRGKSGLSRVALHPLFFSLYGAGANFKMSDVAIKYLSTSEAERASLPRILQMSSEEQYTKYEMCKLFAEILGVPLDNMEANTEGNDPNASVQRPYDCHLSTKAVKDLGIDVSTQDFVGWWRRELRAFRH